MKEKEQLTDEQLWLLCDEVEQQKKVKLKIRMRNEDSVPDMYEYNQIYFDPKMK